MDSKNGPCRLSCSPCAFTPKPPTAEIAEKLIFAINNSQDGTRKETPFYLVHGWDAQSTLKAMSSSLKRGSGRQSDALAWRREVNRQQEIALSMAKEYQATEKARRAKEHNEALGRQEKESLPSLSGEVDPNETPPRSLFAPGSRVWLYM
ncbi:hypothetical protein PR003_g19612 [Phytophthora rubi]|uniref:Uncharacterized protein n=1 Tax=Phytophthora rubi TaxID=129364 RepID=A0A6A4DXX0_9STRA|nr:hypothetical protein PR003_g19612 [Phytophthora rubi]